MSVETVENHIPIINIINDVVLMRNGDYAIGFSLNLSEVFTIGEEKLNELHQLWSSIIKSLPDNCVLHKQDWYEKKNYKPNFKEQNVIDRSIEFHFCEKEYINQSAFLYIIQSNKVIVKNKRATSTLLSSRIFSRNITDNKKRKEFETYCRNVESQINASKLISCIRLTKTDYVNEKGGGLLNKYVNLGDDNIMRDIDYRNDDYIGVGQKKGIYYSMGALENLPSDFIVLSEKNNSDYPFSSMYGIGLGLKVNHIYNQVFFKDNQDKIYSSINSKRAGMVSFEKASPENGRNAQLIHEFLDSDKEIVRFHGNILTWGNNIDEMHQNSMEVSTALNRLGFVIKEEKINNPILHWSGFPGAAAGEIPFDLTCTMKYDEAATFVVNEANYKSSVSDYGLKLLDRINRVPILVDITKEPMEKELIFNINKFLVGGSGSGKSFLTNEKIRTDLKHGNHVIIGDIGGSYKRQCNLLAEKGAYLEHTDENPLSFNPFWVKTKKELHTEKLFFINKTIFTCAGMILEENNTKANIMKKLLIEYYDYCFDFNVFPCMNTFYKFMKMYYEDLKVNNRSEITFMNFEELLINLEQFTTGGQFQHLLNATTNFDLMSKQMIVFDLETVKDDKTLFTLVTLMIMSTMIDKLFRMAYVMGEEASSKIIKSLILDEAWKALMNDTMADFIKYAAKTFRKHNGELMLITQEPDDLLSNPKMATTLLGNCATKIFGDVSSLGNKMDPVLDLFELPSNEKRIIKSLNKIKVEGVKEREFYFKTGVLGRVYAFESTPEQNALYSTSKEVSSKVNSLVQQFNGNVGLAISEYVSSVNN